MAASISRKSTRPGVNAGTVSFTDATDTGTDTGTYRHKVGLAVVELGGCIAGTDAGVDADLNSDRLGHHGDRYRHIYVHSGIGSCGGGHIGIKLWWRS